MKNGYKAEMVVDIIAAILIVVVSMTCVLASIYLGYEMFDMCVVMVLGIILVIGIDGFVNSIIHYMEWCDDDEYDEYFYEDEA